MDGISNEIYLWCITHVLDAFNQKKTLKGFGFNLNECKVKFPTYSDHILTLAITNLIIKDIIYVDILSREYDYLYHDIACNNIITQYI